MAEELTTEEGLDVLDGQEGKETEVIPTVEASRERAPTEVACTPEKPSAEIVSNPATPSNPSETVAPKVEINPADGASWEALSKEVGEATP